MDPYLIIEWVARIIAIMLVFSLHEFAHAYVAYKCGDYTPKANGRLTLNPIQHIDILGFAMLFFAGFGWAKPVPINPYNFKKIRSGMFWTSVAGVIVNICFAFVIYPFLLLSYKLPTNGFAFAFLSELFWQIYIFNLCSFVFNLIPLFPLDGFHVLETCFKRDNKFLEFLRKYGQYILMGLVIFSMIADRVEALRFLDILGYFLNFAINIVGRPISLFWQLIFSIF